MAGNTPRNTYTKLTNLPPFPNVPTESPGKFSKKIKKLLQGKECRVSNSDLENFYKQIFMDKDMKPKSCDDPCMYKYVVQRFRGNEQKFDDFVAYCRRALLTAERLRKERERRAARSTVTSRTPRNTPRTAKNSTTPRKVWKLLTPRMVNQQSAHNKKMEALRAKRQNMLKAQRRMMEMPKVSGVKAMNKARTAKNNSTARKSSVLSRLTRRNRKNTNKYA